MRNMVRIAIAAGGLVLAGAAYAADMLETQAPAAMCIGGQAVVLVPESDTLKSDVVRLMDEAVGVAESPVWVASPRPAFLWANETKVACGKAYGYLRSGYEDAEYLYKCECFHARMVSYMN